MTPVDTPVFDSNTTRPGVSVATVTPGTIDRNQDTGGVSDDTSSDGRNTPPAIQSAIADITNYEFDPGLDESSAGEQQKNAEEEAIAAALMMFNTTNATGATELPKLRTEPWPYSGSRPNPISIGTARKLLSAAYAEIPCELEAAGDHGYAWVIEEPTVWLARYGVSNIVPPTKPKEVVGFDMKLQWEYLVKAKRYTTYKHMAQEGRRKIMEWFGPEMFHDLFKNDALPPHYTPKDLLDHISSIYATPNANRACMEQVEEKVNGPYDKTKPVEVYFKQLQDARTHATMLGIAYTDEQIMNKALKQFEAQYEKDSYKAEKKWNERDSSKRTWPAFRTYWKEEIHQLATYAARSKKKSANNAVDVQGIMESVTALRAEAQSLREHNDTLSQQLQFQQGTTGDTAAGIQPTI